MLYLSGIDKNTKIIMIKRVIEKASHLKGERLIVGLSREFERGLGGDVGIEFFIGIS